MIDEAAFASLREDLQEDLDEFLRMFLMESPRLWDEARAGAAAGDLTRVRRALHTLRTSTALVGMRDAAAEMSAIEKLPDDAPDRAARLAKLDAELRRDWETLRGYRM